MSSLVRLENADREHIYPVLLKALDQARVILFEAFYWGRYVLEHPVTVFDGKVKLATLENPEGHFPLFFERGKSCFSIPDFYPLPVATDLSEFFGGIENVLQKISDLDNRVHFDNRPSLEKLLQPEKILKTGFHDPEAFEEVEAYEQLLEMVETYLGGLRFESRQVLKMDGFQKHVQIKLKGTEFETTLRKELFDNEIIHLLNQVLHQHAKGHSQLRTTIGENMEMLVLKLSPDENQKLERMGLLI